MNKKLYKWMNWPEIEAIVYGESDNPHKLLGLHSVAGGTLVQFFYPDAQEVTVMTSDKKYPMELADEKGFFAALLPKKVEKDYKFEVTFGDGKTKTIEDPYQFEPIITKKDTETFGKGHNYEIYKLLGAHPMTVNNIKGVLFAVWAPNALRVSVVGDFNEWDGRVHQMRRLGSSGIFEIFVPEAEIGQNYKFEICVKGGLTFLKSDPYGQYAQLRPDNASVIYNLSDYPWKDEKWIQKRENYNIDVNPMNIYELYLGSFARKSDDEKNPYYNYKELAPMVADYVLEMGYTHIELMPIMEHPFDGSWGYQTIGYYAPTSRYGTPDDFRYFVDYMHEKEIGVILDWVPAHFPKDAHGLANFDGTHLYEHADPRKGMHPDWGTLIYNYARPEVANYLVANVLYWIKEFHADGIRMDAVASMLYLDYGRKDGQWIPNMYGGKENLEAIEFIKHVNSIVHKKHKGVLMIAEESTAWPRVTGAIEEDGLGFDLKWNMGWMNDFLEYMRQDPLFRKGHHGELTFSMIYQYSEKFALVLSHDEVVHGKASMIGKMPGENKDKFKNLRAAYGYMMMHPGKKLLFMGQDIAEFDEWNENRSVEWDLLNYPEHKAMKQYVKALNQFYRKNPALYELDNSPEGFEWINCISANENVLVFVRKAKNSKNNLLVVCNFANEQRDVYRVGVPVEGKYKEIFNSDAKEFGGDNVVNKIPIASTEKEWDDKEDSIAFKMPALSIQVFSHVPFTAAEKKEIDRRKAAYKSLKEKEHKIKEAKDEMMRVIQKKDEVVRLAKDARLRAVEMERRAKESLKQAEELEERASKANESVKYCEEIVEKLEKELIEFEKKEEALKEKFAESNKTAVSGKKVSPAAKKASTTKKTTVKRNSTIRK